MRKVYETKRLVLKELDENDAEIVFSYMKRNKTFFEMYEPERSNDFYTLEYQREQLIMDKKYSDMKAMLRLWLFKKEDLRKTIGQITFYNIVPFAFCSCHLGYKCDKDEVNKGYITEGTKKGIEVMFNQYNLHRIEGYIQETNIESLRVVEKLGFNK